MRSSTLYSTSFVLLLSHTFAQISRDADPNFPRSLFHSTSVKSLKASSAILPLMVTQSAMPTELVESRFVFSLAFFSFRRRLSLPLPSASPSHPLIILSLFLFYQCDTNFVYKANKCQCKSPFYLCGDVCSSTICPTGGMSNGRRSILRGRERCTRKGHTFCPVQGSEMGMASGGKVMWECLSTDSGLESCEFPFLLRLRPSPPSLSPLFNPQRVAHISPSSPFSSPSIRWWLPLQILPHRSSHPRRILLLRPPFQTRSRLLSHPLRRCCSMLSWEMLGRYVRAWLAGHRGKGWLREGQQDSTFFRRLARLIDASPFLSYLHSLSSSLGPSNNFIHFVVFLSLVVGPL